MNNWGKISQYNYQLVIDFDDEREAKDILERLLEGELREGLEKEIDGYGWEIIPQ